MSLYYSCDEVTAVQKLYRDIFALNLAQLSVEQLLDLQAERMQQAHRNGDTAICFQLRCWSPSLLSQTTEHIMNLDTLSLETCRTSMAREYGYTDWNHVKQSNHSHDADFEFAVQATVTGDIESLKQVVTQKPDSVRQCSCYAHNATLLHYLGANGVETQRQTTPYAAAEIAAYLLESGSDVNATANMYGGSSPLALMTTSAHPAGAGVIEDLVTAMRKYGAR